jgi:archaellum biogenesis ATPase FlaH
MSLAELLDDGNDPNYDAMVEFAKEMQEEAISFTSLREGGARVGELTVITAGEGVGKSIFDEELEYA